MPGPLGLPWSTFAALLVILASIVASIVWAFRGSSGDDGETPDE